MESVSNKDIELFSEEVQEVMNRIPSAIVRWGMTIMAVIVCGLLLVAAYMPWPETIEAPFNGMIKDNISFIEVSISPDLNKSLFNLDNRVIIYSPMVHDKFTEHGITGVIKESSIKNTTEGYITRLKIELTEPEISANTTEFSGKILIINSELSLLERIIDNINIVNKRP